MRLLQPDRVVRLEPYIYQRRSLQDPPAITFACQRDRPLLGVRPALVVVAKLPELAVAVVFAGKGHAVVTPCQQAAVFHQHRGMPGPCMGIAGQFRRPLYHLLRHMAVLAVEWPPLGLLPWLHTCHPFAPKTSCPARKFVEGVEIRLPASVLRQLAGTIRARTRIVAEAVAENPAETRPTYVNRTC